MKKFLLIILIAACTPLSLVHAQTQSCGPLSPGAQCESDGGDAMGSQDGGETCTCPSTSSSGSGNVTPQSNQSAGFVPLTNIPGLTSGVATNQSGIANFLNNLYKYLIGLAAVLAVIEIVWGGIEISTQDSISKHEAGKERIQGALLGLVLVLLPVLVFSIINPQILNLSFNLPPIAAHSGTSIGGGGTQTNNAPEVNGFPANSNNQTGSPSLLQAPQTLPSGACSNIQNNTNNLIQPNQVSCCGKITGCYAVNTGTQNYCDCDSTGQLSGGTI
jgi:hypothetical protein